jgi:hypothetical protein
VQAAGVLAKGRMFDMPVLTDNRRKYCGLGRDYHRHITVKHVQSALIIKFSNIY